MGPGEKNLAESSSFWDGLSARPARRGIDSGQVAVTLP